MSVRSLIPEQTHHGNTSAVSLLLQHLLNEICSSSSVKVKDDLRGQCTIKLSHISDQVCVCVLQHRQT